MQRQRTLSIATVLALVASLLLTAIAGANPPAPDDLGTPLPSDLTVGPRTTNLGKTIDQPNPIRLLAQSRSDSACSTTASISRPRHWRKPLTTASWSSWSSSPAPIPSPGTPAIQWDPIGKADPNEQVLDARRRSGPRRLLQHHHPDQDFHLQRPAPQPDSAAPLGKRIARATRIWTEDFSTDWFEAFMWGDGVKFQYTRQDGSVVNEDFTGKSVKEYFLDMSGGDYEIAGDVIGWVQVPHSTWYYDADQCPGARSTHRLSGVSAAAIPGARQRPHLVKDCARRRQRDQQHDPRLRLAQLRPERRRRHRPAVDRARRLRRGRWHHLAQSHRLRRGRRLVAFERRDAGLQGRARRRGRPVHRHARERRHRRLRPRVRPQPRRRWTSTPMARARPRPASGPLQADDWTGYPIGYEPPSVDPMHLDWWGWLKPMVITDPGQTYTVQARPGQRLPRRRAASTAAPRSSCPTACSTCRFRVAGRALLLVGRQEDVANGQDDHEDADRHPRGRRHAHASTWPTTSKSSGTSCGCRRRKTAPPGRR